MASLQGQSQSFTSYPSSSPTPQALLTQISDSEIWHKCLGHLALPIVNHVLTLCNIQRQQSFPSQFYNACQYDKSHQLPFTLSYSRVVKPFELINTDLWGPSPINYVMGICYFLLFIDDYTCLLGFIFLPLKIKSIPPFSNLKPRFKINLILPLRECNLTMENYKTMSNIRYLISSLMFLHTLTKWSG